MGSGHGRTAAGFWRDTVTDPHQPATAPGTDRADVEERSALAAALGHQAWPAERDALVAKAQEAGATDEIVDALRRLPHGERFGSAQDVARALGLGTEQQRF
jgi:hypothetical protein